MDRILPKTFSLIIVVFALFAILFMIIVDGTFLFIPWGVLLFIFLIVILSIFKRILRKKKRKYYLRVAKNTKQQTAIVEKVDKFSKDRVIYALKDSQNKLMSSLLVINKRDKFLRPDDYYFSLPVGGKVFYHEDPENEKSIILKPDAYNFDGMIFKSVAIFIGFFFLFGLSMIIYSGLNKYQFKAFTHVMAKNHLVWELRASGYDPDYLGKPKYQINIIEPVKNKRINRIVINIPEISQFIRDFQMHQINDKVWVFGADDFNYPVVDVFDVYTYKRVMDISFFANHFNELNAEIAKVEILNFFSQEHHKFRNLGFVNQVLVLKFTLDNAQIHFYDVINESYISEFPEFVFNNANSNSAFMFINQPAENRSANQEHYLVLNDNSFVNNQLIVDDDLLKNVRADNLPNNLKLMFDGKKLYNPRIIYQDYEIAVVLNYCQPETDDSDYEQFEIFGIDKSNNVFFSISNKDLKKKRKINEVISNRRHVKLLEASVKRYETELVIIFKNEAVIAIDTESGIIIWIYEARK